MVRLECSMASPVRARWSQQPLASTLASGDSERRARMSGPRLALAGSAKLFAAPSRAECSVVPWLGKNVRGGFTQGLR